MPAGKEYMADETAGTTETAMPAERLDRGDTGESSWAATRRAAASAGTVTPGPGVTAGPGVMVENTFSVPTPGMEAGPGPQHGHSGSVDEGGP